MQKPRNSGSGSASRRRRSAREPGSTADAVLFMTAHLLSEFAGGGIGRMLVQAMAKDLTWRGMRAIEAFGGRRWESPARVLPVDYLLAVGFKTVRPHHHYPQLRMELKTVLTLREVAWWRSSGCSGP